MTDFERLYYNCNNAKEKQLLQTFKKVATPKQWAEALDLEAANWSMTEIFENVIGPVKKEKYQED